MARNRNRNRNNHHTSVTAPKVENVIPKDDQNLIPENEVKVDNVQTNESIQGPESQTPEVIGDDVTNKDTTAPQSPPEEPNTEESEPNEQDPETPEETPEEVVIVNDGRVIHSTEDSPKVLPIS